MFRCKVLGDNVPGKVYLCQVNDNVSCGACCGLYNVLDARLESLETILSRRTETFRGVPRDIDGLLGFKEKVASMEGRKRPYPRFHHCPYIGFIGEGGRRVGCLLHPLAEGNKGVDLRGFSFYGGMACRVYFCPTCHRLSPAWKEVVVRTAPHWYLYGLIVTESDMLENFFRHVEDRIHRPLLVEDICDNDRATEYLWAFFSQKLDWPYRDHSLPVWGNYFFHDAMYAHPSIDYEGLGAPPSTYDPVLRALRSDLKDIEELKAAELLLDEMVENVAFSIASQPSRGIGIEQAVH